MKFPGKPGFGARLIETEDDVRDVIPCGGPPWPAGLIVSAGAKGQAGPRAGRTECRRRLLLIAAAASGSLRPVPAS